MKRDFRILSLALILIFGLAACREKSPKLVGTPPPEARTQKGNGLQTLKAKVDILFVIDDSGSMQVHQTNLAKNIDKFLVGLQTNRFIDYHIGVISTSEEENTFGTSGSAPGAGRLTGATKFVTKHTFDGINILKRNMLIGTYGSAIERMFSPVKQALTEPNLSGWNSGFYRADAFLAVVYITDAEDQSDIDYGYPRRDPSLNMSPSMFYDFLLGLKRGNKLKIVSYGAYVPSTVPNAVCAWDDSSTPPRRLEEFFKLSRALGYSLCDADFGTKLGNIGQDLVNRIGRSLTLDRRPDPNTIVVRYGSQIIAKDAIRGWSYDEERNAVYFGRQIEWTDQPEGTEVEISFDLRED